MHRMFFVVFISLLVSLSADDTGAVSDVISLMVWFTVSPSNYSSPLLSFTWHFLTVAPDEIAVYHLAFYASVVFCCVGHHISSSCLTFSPQHHEMRCACFPRSLLCRCDDLPSYSMSCRKVQRSCLLSRGWVLPLWSWHVIYLLFWIIQIHVIKCQIWCWLKQRGLNVFLKDSLIQFSKLKTQM